MEGTKPQNQTQEKSSPLTCYFWVRDEFLPAAQCTPAQAGTLLALAGYADPDGSNSRPGRPNLMRATKYDRDTIREAIKFWLGHKSGVLVEVSRGNGKTHASVFSIIMMPDVGQSKGADAKTKGAGHPPLTGEQNKERGGPDAPLDEKEAAKGRERGGEGAEHPPIPSTVVPNSKSSSPAGTSSTDGTSDDDLRFEKARDAFLAKTVGPKDELAAALDLFRERSRHNGNEPVRNWKAYFETCFANFLDSDWKTVRDRLARAAKVLALTSPEAKAKAQRLWTAAKETGWNNSEFSDFLFREFHQPLQPTVESLAQLSEWDYQTALTRFRRPPDSLCKECGQRGCEHLRAERERWLAPLRQSVQRNIR